MNRVVLLALALLAFPARGCFWRTHRGTLHTNPAIRRGGPTVAAHQLFIGPSALGIHRNYTVSFGAQFPIYQDVGSAFPKERVRFAVNFSYLLFQHHSDKGKP